MPIHEEKAVLIHGCQIVWDGITRPEENDGGNTRWNLKVVIDPNNPDLQLLDQFASQELQNSEFKGVLPNGGKMPIGMAGPNEFNGLYNGWAVVNASTFKQPKVFDEKTGQLLQPMQYGNLLYGGQVVSILVHCKAYNNMSKGVAARLDGFSVTVSANAPRQEFGGGGVDAAAAFGGGQQPAQQPAQQPQQAWGQQPQQPAQQPAQQPQQAWGQQPQQPAQAPAQQPQQQPAQQPQQQWVQQAPTQQHAPAQQPQQAHNFLPGQ